MKKITNMNLEEKRTRVKEILNQADKMKGKFFTLDDDGNLVMNIRLEYLKEIRRLLDQAQSIDPEDGPTKRKLREAEEGYQAWLKKFMES